MFDDVELNEIFVGVKSFDDELIMTVIREILDLIVDNGSVLNSDEIVTLVDAIRMLDEFRDFVKFNDDVVVDALEKVVDLFKE